MSQTNNQKKQQVQQQQQQKVPKNMLSLKETEQKQQLKQQLKKQLVELNKVEQERKRQKEEKYKESAEYFDKQIKKEIKELKTDQRKRNQKYEQVKNETYAKSQKIMADMENYVSFINTKLVKLKEKLDKKYQDSIKKINTELSILRDEFENLKKLIKILQNDKKQLTSIIFQLKLDLADTKEMIHELKIIYVQEKKYMIQKYEQEKNNMKKQYEQEKTNMKTKFAQEKKSLENEKKSMEDNFEKEKAELVPKKDVITKKKVKRTVLLKQIDDRIKQVKENIQNFQDIISKNNDEIKEIVDMGNLRKNFHKKQLKNLNKRNKSFDKRISEYKKEIELLDSILKLPGLEGKGCKMGYAINPKTRRCVSLKSKLGKKLLLQGIISNCKKDEILNTKTNKCIRRNTPEGRKILSAIGLNDSQKLLDKYYKKQKKIFAQVNNRVKEIESTLTTCQVQNKNLSGKLFNLELEAKKVENEYQQKKQEISQQ